jgi:hypothetical protein
MGDPQAMGVVALSVDIHCLADKPFCRQWTPLPNEKVLRIVQLRERIRTGNDSKASACS